MATFQDLFWVPSVNFWDGFKSTTSQLLFAAAEPKNVCDSESQCSILWWDFNECIASQHWESAVLIFHPHPLGSSVFFSYHAESFSSESFIKLRSNYNYLITRPERLWHNRQSVFEASGLVSHQPCSICFLFFSPALGGRKTFEK